MSFYLLPFDHRTTFIKDILGYKTPLSKKQIEEIKKYKNIIWEAFIRCYKKSKNKKDFGILIDEEFGSEIIKKAKKLGVVIAVAVEKSGQDIFDFEYGEKFGEHILKIRPSYSKVLVRYNPQNKKDNILQLKRLKRLNDFCYKNKIKLLFELIVVPIKKRNNAGIKQGPQIAVNAIKEIRKFGIEPDLWKLEAMPKKRDWEKIINAIKQKNKKKVNIIVLGKGGSKRRVEEWLKTASFFPQIIGFAIGRTIFIKPLQKFKNKKISKKEAVEEIKNNFTHFIKLWEKLHTKNLKINE
ncbi:MAG: DUF2090 domain-containing protein [Candidatus Woesearchaeota archaeon]